MASSLKDFGLVLIFSVIANWSNFHHPYDDATDFCDLFDNFRYGKLNLSIIHPLEVLYSWANEWLLGTVSVTLTSYVLWNAPVITLNDKVDAEAPNSTTEYMMST